MKILIFALLLMATTFPTLAQNGGQYPENGSVKLEYVGSGIVKVTNKQSCQSVITVKDSKTETNLTVNGNSFALYTLSPGLTSNIDIKAKATTNCGGTDFGWVELFIATLPVTFTSFNASHISGNQYWVNFEVGNPSEVKQYNIQQSTDGIIWKTITVLLPDDRSKYSIKVNLQK